MRLLSAFLRRDFFIETSYRFAFLATLGGILFNLLIFYFLSQFVGTAAAPYLTLYNGDYFSFVLIGIALGNYVGVGLNSFAQSLRLAQTTGTLEAMLMTPTALPAIVTGSAAWSYVFATIRVLAYLLLGVGLAGVSFSGANYGAAAAGLALAIVVFASIGIIAASIIMVIKRGDPVTALFAGLNNLLGGVYYPIEVLPDWLQSIARLLPITYALRIMRGALLSGASWADLRTDFLILALFCVILLPVSLLTFRFAVQRARQEGSLAHY